MAKERITVSIADLKMNLITADPDAVRKMAASLDARISRLSKVTRCTKNNALAMIIMEQAEGQKRSAEIIRAQQEQIFTLIKKNMTLSENEQGLELYETLENTLMSENAALRRRNEELIAELAELKASIEK